MNKFRLALFMWVICLAAACFWMGHPEQREITSTWIIVLEDREDNADSQFDSMAQAALLEAVRVMPHQIYIKCCDTIQCQGDLDQRAIVEVSMDITVDDSSPLIDRWQPLYATPKLLDLLPLVGKIDFSEPWERYDSLRQELRWWLISLEYEGLEKTFFIGPVGDISLTEAFCDLRVPLYDSTFYQSLDWGTVNGRLQLKRIFRTY